MTTQPTYTIKKSDTEEVQLALKQYKGKDYIDIRTYFLPENEDKKIPTKKGITLNVNQLQELAKGLKKISEQLPD